MDAEDEDWDVDAFEQLDNIVAQHQQQKQALGQQSVHSQNQRAATNAHSHLVSVSAQTSYGARLSAAQHATASLQTTGPDRQQQGLQPAAGAPILQQCLTERGNAVNSGTPTLQYPPSNILGDSAAINRLALERDQALAELTSYRRKVEALEREKIEVAHRAGLLGSRAGLGGASSTQGGLGANAAQQHTMQQMAALQKQLECVQQQLNHALYEAAEASRKVNDKDRRLREAEEQVVKARRQADQHAAEVAQLQEELRAVQERAAAALRNHGIAFGAGMVRPAANHHQNGYDHDMHEVQDAAPSTPPANRGSNIAFPGPEPQQPRQSVVDSVANYQAAGKPATMLLDPIVVARDSTHAVFLPMPPANTTGVMGPASGASSRVASRPDCGAGAPSKVSSPTTAGKQVPAAASKQHQTPVKDLTTVTVSNQAPVCSIAIPAVNDIQTHRPALWQKLWSLDAVSMQVSLDAAFRAQQKLAAQVPSYSTWSGMPVAEQLQHSDSYTVLNSLVQVGQQLLQLAPSSAPFVTPIPLHALMQPAAQQPAAAGFHKHQDTQPGHTCIATLVQFLEHAMNALTMQHGSSGTAATNSSASVLPLLPSDGMDQQRATDCPSDLYQVLQACLRVLSMLLQHSSSVGDLLLSSVTQPIHQQPNTHSYSTTSSGVLKQTTINMKHARPRGRQATTHSAWHHKTQKPSGVGQDTFLATLLSTCYGLLQQVKGEASQRAIVCGVADVLHQTANRLPVYGPRQYTACILSWQLPGLPLSTSGRGSPPLFIEELLSEASGTTGIGTGVGLMCSILEYPGTAHLLASLLQGVDASHGHESKSSDIGQHSNGQQEMSSIQPTCPVYLQPTAITSTLVQQIMLTLLEAMRLDDHLDSEQDEANCLSQQQHAMPAERQTHQKHDLSINNLHQSFRARGGSYAHHHHESIVVQRSLLQVCCMLLEAQHGQALLQCMCDQSHQQGIPGLGQRLLGLAAAAVLHTWPGSLGGSQPSGQGIAPLQPVSPAMLQQHVQLAEEALLLLREMLAQGSDSLRLALLEDLASEADSQHGLHNATTQLQEWGSGVLLTPGQRAIPCLPLAPWARRFKSTASDSGSNIRQGTLSSSMESIRTLVSSVNKAAAQFMVTQSNAMQA